MTSADAQVEVAVGDYDAMLLCLIAEVATAYTDYRTFDERLKFAQRNIKIQEASLRLTQNKADEGATGYTSVALAESNLAATKAAIPALEIGKRQASNRLCTLIGMPTKDLDQLLGDAEIPKAPPEVAVGIPADLLRRRPDIRAAERAVAAQSEQVGIAISDLYPHFQITGEIAWESENFSDLFASGSNSGSVGPSFSWDLLNYGRIVGNIDLQEAGLQELIASYQNAVLLANEEAENAIIAFLQNQQLAKHLKDTADATQEALKLQLISFEEGESDFSGVFVLQGDLVERQDQLARAKGDIALSLINLYKALGGGWEIRCTGFFARQIATEDQTELEIVPTPEPDESSSDEIPLPSLRELGNEQ